MSSTIKVIFASLSFLSVAEFCWNTLHMNSVADIFIGKHTAGQVVFSDPYRVSPYNRWNSPPLDHNAEAVRNDNALKVEIAELKSKFVERTQALIYGDLHTGSVMVTQESTQVIDPEFAFYGPIGFDVGAFLGNRILAYFAQDGHADAKNDRKVYVSHIFDLFFTFF
ncbi:hypothetical protein TIFTF001_007085 [Ficus carica]|uniref:Aminoglycoside phosphotransferase domain-containing protein n=1 Tax=Ficus carica TaxID=3494 RepID=A0AA87ZKG3_FICCA|nr:hypothetical protein TIFTF001_007085 [Ficus carica]